MKSHRVYEHMVGRRRELTPHEEIRLAAHLDICERCRDAAHAYDVQDVLLRPLSHARAPVRDRVLAAIDRPASARRLQWSPLQAPRLPRIGHLLARVSLAVLAACAIAVNSPLLDTAGAAQSPFRYWASSTCNAEGYALLNYQRILSSPAQFRGPGVVFLNSGFIEAQNNLAHPIYYVFPRSPSSAACQPNAHVTDILIAINTRTGAELHAVGLTPGS